MFLTSMYQIINTGLPNSTYFSSPLPLATIQRTLFLVDILFTHSVSTVIIARGFITSAEEGGYVFPSVCLSVLRITEEVGNGF